MYYSLTLNPKGVRRARAMLDGSEAQDPWRCSGAHLPDVGSHVRQCEHDVCRGTP